MLGDLNNDNQWNNKDHSTLDDVLAHPFQYDSLLQLKMDINRNGAIDEEDLEFLRHMYQFSEP